MKTYTISQLARAFGLSRSTLLYYDRIGLLPPGYRNESGYRFYTGKDYRRLERICNFRDAGLTLENIREAISADKKPPIAIFEKRLQEINSEVKTLKNKQSLLSDMLRSVSTVNLQPKLNKDLWVDMLRKAGMNEDAMAQWNKEFERRAPEEHHEFLISLGISEDEARHIRSLSADSKPD